jgi:hypothetical protein
MPASKVRQLLHFSVADNFNKNQSAKRLRIARSSATKYIEAFKSSALTLTDNQHADPPYPIGLLRPRSERPRNRRTAENREKIAPSHVRPKAQETASYRFNRAL